MIAKSRFLFLSILAFSLLTISCKKSDNTEENCENFHWSYEGEGGPEFWLTCYEDCGGIAQSPIDITSTRQDPMLSALSTDYKNAPIHLLNNGHSIEYTYTAGSTLNLNGDNFELLQLHFHTQSEHTVNGMHYPMEVHLVHKNESTGQLAVIGVFFVEGAENTFLDAFIENLPANTDDQYVSEKLLSASDLLPANQGYYSYTGSLTTPPCSEIVSWFVMKTPIEASSAQIEKMHEIMHDNFRPVQALNGREVTEFN
jgi:carbonic anhydrase